MFFIFFNVDNNFSLLFLSISSSISNIGFSLDVPQNLSFIFLILIIIGGSFFSTSSGLRFSKLFLLFKFSINELVSHAKPKNVYSNKLPFFSVNLETEDFYKYFLSVVIFIISLSLNMEIGLSTSQKLTNLHFCYGYCLYFCLFLEAF